jgi:hypothetical protein
MYVCSNILSPIAGRMQSRPLLVLLLCCGALPWGGLASKSILRISLADLREGIRGQELELALRQDGALGMESRQKIISKSFKISWQVL